MKNKIKSIIIYFIRNLNEKFGVHAFKSITQILKSF
jgi:hypothetical protein